MREPLGWTPVCFAEIEPFPAAVLAHRYPRVPNLGDMMRVDWSRYRGKCDLVAAGTPCQAFSAAGGRKSLSDPRGNLTLAFVEAVNAIDPTFVVWENVPYGKIYIRHIMKRRKKWKVWHEFFRKNAYFRI